MFVVDILGATLAPPPFFRHLNGPSLHFPENNSPFAAVLELMPTRRGKRASSINVRHAELHVPNLPLLFR